MIAPWARSRRRSLLLVQLGARSVARGRRGCFRDCYIVHSRRRLPADSKPHGAAVAHFLQAAFVRRARQALGAAGAIDASFADLYALSVRARKPTKPVCDVPVGGSRRATALVVRFTRLGADTSARAGPLSALVARATGVSQHRRLRLAWVITRAGCRHRPQNHHRHHPEHSSHHSLPLMKPKITVTSCLLRGNGINNHPGG